MQDVLVNRLGGLSLPWKSVVMLTDCPDMTIDVYRVDVKQQHNDVIPISRNAIAAKSICNSNILFQLGF